MKLHSGASEILTSLCTQALSYLSLFGDHCRLLMRPARFTVSGLTSALTFGEMGCRQGSGWLLHRRLIRAGDRGRSGFYSFLLLIPLCFFFTSHISLSCSDLCVLKSVWMFVCLWKKFYGVRVIRVRQPWRMSLRRSTSAPCCSSDKPWLDLCFDHALAHRDARTHAHTRTRVRRHAHTFPNGTGPKR